MYERAVLKMLHVKQLLAVLVLCLVSGSAIAESTFAVGSGAFVIDGDTFRLGSGVSVRLFGIDAPECRKGQRRDGQCDRPETGMLIVMLELGRVTCREIERDRYNRIIAQCLAGSRADIGRQLVERGMARAVRWTGSRLVYGEGVYAEAERQAVMSGAGYWKCNIESPPKFREIKIRHCRGI